MSKSPNSNDEMKNRPPITPRWVKVAGIIVVILILLFFILKLTGIGSNHGPGRHIPEGDQTEQSVPVKQTLFVNLDHGITIDDGGHL